MTVLDFYVPPPSVDVDVYGVCQRIEQWASSADDIGALKDNKSKLSAIDQYLAQTSREGRAVIAATVRRLEVRIGEVLGAPQRGGDRRSEDQPRRDAVGLADYERTFFRKMAAHTEVVEAVIAKSTDANPASRSQVLEAIKTVEEAAMETVPTGLDTSRHAVEARVARAKEMAASGHTSRQIAKEIGITPDTMSGFRARHGVEVPADKVMRGGGRPLDSTRIIDGTVAQVTSIDSLFEHIDYDAVDLTDVDYWLTTLNSAIKSLTTLRNKLKEISQ